MRAYQNQRRTLLLAFRRTQRAFNRRQIIPILNCLSVPSVRFETQGTIFRERNVSPSGKRDVVVIVEEDQFAELQMTRERRGLRRNAFHQIAVAYQRISIMIDNLVTWAVVARGEIVFRDRHADTISESLTERTGRCLHSRRQSAFRMSGSLASPLAK